MKTLPANVLPFHRSPVFDESTAPQTLQNAHQTKEGIWGMIVVVEGQLLYRILEPVVEELTLTVYRPGIVEPQTRHEVEPVGAVRFYIQLYR